MLSIPQKTLDLKIPELVLIATLVDSTNRNESEVKTAYKFIQLRNEYLSTDGEKKTLAYFKFTSFLKNLDANFNALEDAKEMIEELYKELLSKGISLKTALNLSESQRAMARQIFETAQKQIDEKRSLSAKL